MDAKDYQQQAARTLIAKPKYDLVEWIENHIDWSQETFGDGKRTIGLCKHIRKELKEIEEAPCDLMEWIDVVILALDGAWRAGHSPESIASALWEKQVIISTRQYPKTSEDEPSEHIRD